MWRRSLAAVGASWGICAGVCYSAFLVYPLEGYSSFATDPYFFSPLKDPSNSLEIRNDRNAKGFYWAKRDGGRKHKGVDYLAPVGTPVLASRAGRVIAAGEAKGYGLYVEIDHGNGFSTRYAHLSGVIVIKGEWVSVGTELGSAGRSGNADNAKIRPHLHFEIRLYETPLDPGRGYLSPTIHVLSRS